MEIGKDTHSGAVMLLLVLWNVCLVLFFLFATDSVVGALLKQEPVSGQISWLGITAVFLGICALIRASTAILWLIALIIRVGLYIRYTV